MAITSTTLSGAAAALDTKIGLTSATGVTAQTTTTGVGLTYLYVENEMMIAVTVNGTLVTVIRGQLGTAQVAHASAAPVIIGGPADFPFFRPAQRVTVPRNDRYRAIAAPVASANTIVQPDGGDIFHVTGTTLIKTITPETNFLEGKITIIFDGVDTWDATGNIAVAGTNTTAGSSVDFNYDAKTSKWYPSRLA